MPTVRTPRRSAAYAAGLLVVPAVLLGLIWMHGIAAHGTSHPVPPASVGATDYAAHHAGHHTADQTAQEATLDHAAAVPADPDHSGSGGVDHGVMLGICLALLVGLAVALALRRTWGRFEGLEPRALLTRPLGAVRRTPDPPSLFGLCILRC